jgi:hypothetical protein
MWLFTSKSFVSIVVDLNDKTKRLVRARMGGDIEELFPNAVVRKGEGTDYLYRASISVEDVAQKVQECIAGMDYGNFKDSVPPDHENRHDAYMEVWDVMHRHQE